MIAPMLPDGAMHRTASLAHVHRVLVPALRLGDIVLTDNLSAHRGAAARNAIRRASVVLRFLLPAAPTSTRSSAKTTSAVHRKTTSDRMMV